MATMTMLVASDVVLNRRHALTTLQSYDWSVLLQFAAAFIWIDGFRRTHVIEWMWEKLLLTQSQYSDSAAIAFLCVFVVVGSNFSSSFLLVSLVLNQLQPCLNQLSMVLYLAWASALAGNLTLFGSVSNFIVIQQTEQLLGYRLSFWSHLQFSFPTTLVFLPLGVLFLYFVLQIT